MKRLKKKASRILYHGTSDIFLDSIKENGLTPGNDNGNSNSKNSDSSYVYVTNSRSDAEDFARFTAEQKGGKPIVLSLNINEELLVPDENTLNYDIFDYDKTLELSGYTEEELYQWTEVKREDNQKFFLPFEGAYGDDPIHYTPDELPFIGGDIFDILEMNLAKYPQTILPNEITKIETV